MTVAATRSAATINAGSVPASSSERWRVEEGIIPCLCWERATPVAPLSSSSMSYERHWSGALPARRVRELQPFSCQTRAHLGDHRLDRYALAAGGEVHRH